MDDARGVKHQTKIGRSNPARRKVRSRSRRKDHAEQYGVADAETLLNGGGPRCRCRTREEQPPTDERHDHRGGGGSAANMSSTVGTQAKSASSQGCISGKRSLNDQIPMTNKAPMQDGVIPLDIGVWSFVGHWGLAIGALVTNLVAGACHHKGYRTHPTGPVRKITTSTVAHGWGRRGGNCGAGPRKST